MARPTSLNDLTAKRILDAIAAGNSRRCAAGYAGIATASLQDWIRRGRLGEEPYAAFLERLERADADAEMERVEKLRQGGQGWQAALAWLQYRRQQTWRKPAESRPDEKQDDTGEITEDVKQAAREWLAKEAKG